MVIDFNPFYDFDQNIDRLMDRFATPISYSQRRESYPVLNISECGENLYVRFEVPGMKMDEIEITLVDASLSIKGERKGISGRYYRQERPTGAFQRVVTINTPIDAEGVNANLKNGILEIILPKSSEAKPKKIVIDG